VTIVAYAKGLQVALEAAEKLAREGVEAEVVDLRTLRPLDMGPVMESYRKTFRAVVVEEGFRSYGVGAEIVARLQEEAFDYMDAPIKRVAQFEVPLPYSQELEQSALINAERVIAAVKEVL
jgi:pyruvate dehydrogenase E1 component beta subunit